MSVFCFGASSGSLRKFSVRIVMLEFDFTCVEAKLRLGSCVVFKKIFKTFVLVCCLTCVQHASAWGERGHSIVSQVAARLLVSRVANGQNVLKPFLTKELMLAHLSNVPDIYWRSLPAEISKPIASTHFVDLEYFGIAKSEDVTVLTVPEALKRLKDNCTKSLLKEKVSCAETVHNTEIFEAAGSAPWRVEQFAKRLKTSLNKLQIDENHAPGKQAALQRKKNGEQAFGKMTQEQERYVVEALVNAGLLAHFVGDLSQPLHTTTDYDGFTAGLGGLHAYFETDVVNAVDLGLALRVHEFAKNLSLKSISGRSSINGTTPLELAFRLSADSFSQLDVLKELDQKYSIVERSSEKGGLRIPGKRKQASQVASFFEPLIVKRLAAAAVVLAEIYFQMWKDSGSPDLSAFDSYVYPLQPELVPVNYY